MSATLAILILELFILQFCLAGLFVVLKTFVPMLEFSHIQSRYSFCFGKRNPAFAFGSL